MKVKKNVRNPAPQHGAGRYSMVDCNYYVVVRGNKHFYITSRQLIQAALAGVA